MPRFQVGDAVMRRLDVFDTRSRMRYGVVLERGSRRDRFGYYPELYRVRWDDGTEEGGFLPHGLHPAGEGRNT